jgi:hypothetical protein
LSVRQVLDEVVPAFERLRAAGKTRFLGLTAVGETAALQKVIDAHAFDSAQVVYNMLNPSAAEALPPNYPAQDYGKLFDHTQAAGVGVVGIRVLAGGALSASMARHAIASPPTVAARCRRLCRQPDRSGDAVCAGASGDGHDPGRHRNAATVRGRACRGRKRAAAGRRAATARAAAAIVCRRSAVKGGH